MGYPSIAVFRPYIALFATKMCHIGRGRLPELVRTTSLSALSAYDRHTRQGFYPINGTWGLLALASAYFLPCPFGHQKPAYSPDFAGDFRYM